jgi:hypothetical protein
LVLPLEVEFDWVVLLSAISTAAFAAVIGAFFQQASLGLRKYWIHARPGLYPVLNPVLGAWVTWVIAAFFSGLPEGQGFWAWDFTTSMRLWGALSYGARCYCFCAEKGLTRLLATVLDAAAGSLPHAFSWVRCRELFGENSLSTSAT